MKKILIGALACACMVGFTLGLVACGQADNGSAELPATGQETVLNGSVLMIPDGFPADSLGEDGDVCFVTENGDFFRKDNGVWSAASIEHYDILESNVLSVTFENGQNGNYKMTTLDEDSSCNHAGLADAEAQVVYESFCVVPGIGVKYCDECRSSFAVILPADPEHHEIHEGENFGRCVFCNLLEDGTSGFVVDNSNVGEALEQLRDGDKLVVNSNEKITFNSEMPLNVSDQKNITVDFKDSEVEFTSENRKSAISVGSGSTLTLTSSTEHSEDGSGKDKVTLDSVTSAVVSVSGKDSHLNIEDVVIDCRNSNTSNVPSISATNGAEVNIDGNTVIYANKYDDLIFAEPYVLKATGKNTVVNINDVTVYADGRVTPFQAANQATLNFNGGEINISSCESAFALSASGGGKLRMTGGTINVVGDLTIGSDPVSSYPSKWDCAIAVGNYPDEYADIAITGGVINLNPSAGTAIAVATSGGLIEVSGDAIINVNAEAGAKAYAFAAAWPGDVIALYDDVEVNITETDDGRNKWQLIDSYYTNNSSAIGDYRNSKNTEG